HRPQRASPSQAHRRSAGPEPHHDGQAAARPPSGLIRQYRGSGPGYRHARGNDQGHSAEGDPGCNARRRQRRLCPPAAGSVEPANQRHQVHPEGRPDTGAAATREFSPRTERQRHRHRDCGNYLPHVFERFSQWDSSTTRSVGGLGLGLAISKQLVELHGGIIKAASKGEGLGATFSVELPLSIVQLQDEGSPRVHPTAETQSTELLSLPRLEGVHVFLVDDEPDARELLRTVLQDQGAKVTSFVTAEEALATLKTTRPTVLVCDIGMPKMDGYQLIRALRALEPRGDRLPALALTAFARAEDRKRSLVAGYQAHLAKPFDVAELILLIADLVGRRRT